AAVRCDSPDHRSRRSGDGENQASYESHQGGAIVGRATINLELTRINCNNLARFCYCLVGRFCLPAQVRPMNHIASRAQTLFAALLVGCLLAPTVQAQEAPPVAQAMAPAASEAAAP